MAGAARSLTHSKGDVQDVAWRPDGRALAFAAADAPPAPVYFDAGDNDYTLTQPIPPVHLWLIDARRGTARRLTSGSWTVAPVDDGGIFSPQFAWSRDGRQIAFTRVANTFTGDDEYSTIWQLDVASSQMWRLTAHSMLELSPSRSPDGKMLSYWYARDGKYLAENSVRVVSEGSDRDLTAHFDRNTGGSLWMPDGRSLLICYNDGTRVRAARLTLDGSVRPFDFGDLNIVCDSYMSSTFDSGIAASVARDGTIAFLANGAFSARELYLLRPRATKPERLTHFNDFLGRIALGEMRSIRWRSADGFDESGVLTVPPAPIAGRRYPIVVLIHGGPGDSSVQSFNWEFWPLAQLIAAHGYLVFQPNYRGSDSAGNAFALAIYRDTVRGPAADILAGLSAVKTLPYADAARVAVCGWSYGGLLTSWLITQRPDFRAAVSGAAVNDEIDEYAISTSNVQDRYYLGTSPYAPGGEAIYADQSPITYAANVTTPTLIWATTLDPVVPIPQAYEFYHALHEHGVPVRFVVFPAATHGPADPVQTAQLTQLWLAWLDRWMR